MGKFAKCCAMAYICKIRNENLHMEAATLRDDTMNEQKEDGDLSGGAWDLSSELKEDSGYLKKLDHMDIGLIVLLVVVFGVVAVNV